MRKMHQNSWDTRLDLNTDLDIVENLGHYVVEMPNVPFLRFKRCCCFQFHLILIISNSDVSSQNAGFC